MTQQAKVLAINSDDPSLIPRTQLVEEDSRLSHLFSDLYGHCDLYAQHPNTHNEKGLFCFVLF